MGWMPTSRTTHSFKLGTHPPRTPYTTRTGDAHDPATHLPRIPLPRTRVDKARGRMGPRSRIPALPPCARDLQSMHEVGAYTLEHPQLPERPLCRGAPSL